MLSQEVGRKDRKHAGCLAAESEGAYAAGSDAGETSAGSPDVLQAMLLLALAEARAKTANEVALAAEKANYAAAEEVERFREVLHSPEQGSRGGCY